MTKLAVSRRNGPKNSSNWRELSNFGPIFTALSSKVEKTRQIERKSRNCPSRFKSRKKLAKLTRIVEFRANFYWWSFKIAIWHKNRQSWPPMKLISELFLVVPSISRIFRLKASKLQFGTKIVKVGHRWG